jgi:hypothetical protein
MRIHTVAPELPARNGEELTEDFVARLCEAYRQGNVWTEKSTNFAELLLSLLDDGKEPLQPKIRTEALDILGRLSKETKMVSPVSSNHVPEHVLPEKLRERIGVILPKAGGSTTAAAPVVA